MGIWEKEVGRIEWERGADEGEDRRMKGFGRRKL